MKKIGNQLQSIWDAKKVGRPLFAILIDPGKLPLSAIRELINLAETEGDIKLMIQAMATRTELLRQAIEESTK